MPRPEGWTRDQQLIALRLYMGTPFGKLHGRNPDIIDLAQRIGRTANALAMKACNFASLDPEFRRTNRTGLSGASEADRALWTEFTANPGNSPPRPRKSSPAPTRPPRPSTNRKSESRPARPTSPASCGPDAFNPSS